MRVISQKFAKYLTKCVWKLQFWDTCTTRPHSGHWVRLITSSFVLAPVYLFARIFCTIICNAPATINFHADNKQHTFRRCSVCVIEQEEETYIGLVLHRHRYKHKLIVMLSALAITSLSYSIIHVYRRGGINIMYLFIPLNRKLCIVYKSQHCVPFIYEARGRYLRQG